MVQFRGNGREQRGARERNKTEYEEERNKKDRVMVVTETKGSDFSRHGLPEWKTFLTKIQITLKTIFRI